MLKEDNLQIFFKASLRLLPSFNHSANISKHHLWWEMQKLLVKGEYLKAPLIHYIAKV